MKKFYSIFNGNIQFYLIVALSIICFIIGCFLIPETICLGVFSFTVISIIVLVIMWKRKYLNYVRIGEECIEYKKRLYTWPEIYFTISPAEDFFSYGHANHPFRFYFESKYLFTNDEIKNCKKKGQFIDINSIEDLGYILKYYDKELSVFKNNPYGKKLNIIIEEHNNNIKNTRI